MVVGFTFDPRKNGNSAMRQKVANDGIQFVAAVFDLIPGQDSKDHLHASEPGDLLCRPAGQAVYLLSDRPLEKESGKPVFPVSSPDEEPPQFTFIVVGESSHWLQGKAEAIDDRIEAAESIAVALQAGFLGHRLGPS